MTNININWMSKQAPVPFLLKPVGKDYLWGGRRLRDDFSKELALSPLAETWECSTHPDGVSTIASGRNIGRSLTDVLKECPNYMGRHANSQGQLPVLVKLIDANQNLSVQVHPDDQYAYKHENASLGKYEMWYVLDAKRDTEIIYGFLHDMDKQELVDSLNDGNIETHLRHIKIKKDDVFCIEPGTVHAIGRGALIAEIQENSNITYRLYDFGRVDKTGKPRELHIDKALDVINFQAEAEPKQPMRVLKYKPGYASELLYCCKYFKVERILINTELCHTMATVEESMVSFQVLLCINGCGTMFAGQQTICFFKGDCIFIPANASGMRLHGRAQLLRVAC